ncbi:VOC family protein [Streptomyces sp. KL116D]|uniref:VOC family protein n=1 Tax=Streptomyces sp. KL116D TaxID=3045152 RepID=UPI00355704D0
MRRPAGHGPVLGGHRLDGSRADRRSCSAALRQGRWPYLEFRRTPDDEVTWNRVHLDVMSDPVTDQAKEVCPARRARSQLGPTWGRVIASWVVLADPRATSSVSSAGRHGTQAARPARCDSAQGPPSRSALSMPVTGSPSPAADPVRSRHVSPPASGRPGERKFGPPLQFLGVAARRCRQVTAAASSGVGSPLREIRTRPRVAGLGFAEGASPRPHRTARRARQ